MPVRLTLGLVIEPMADDSDGERGGELAEPAEHGRPDARGEDCPYPRAYAGEREQAYRCRTLGTVADHWHDQEQRHRNVQQTANQRRITKREGPPLGLRSRHDLVRAYELVYRHREEARHFPERVDARLAPAGLPLGHGRP